MAYVQFPIDEVSVEDLVLDVSNYRFPVDQPSEGAAMNYLFAADGVMEVARIILRDGYIDNELPLVVEETNGLVILEGNRRLSALRALLDPSLVPSFQTELERLLRRYAPEVADLPKVIRVMRFPDRESAAPVLARLHIGESKKAWSLDEQAKFVLAQLTDGVTVEALKEQLPAIKDVVRLVRMGRVREMLRGVPFSDRSLADFATGDQLAMSSFEYAYRNSEIQRVIGIAFDDAGQLATTPSTPAHIAALTRLLRGFQAGELNTRRGLRPGTDDFRRLLADMRGDSTGDVAGPPTQGGEESADLDPPSEGGAQAEDGPHDVGGGQREPSADTALASEDASGLGDGTKPGRGPNNPATKKSLDLTGIDETQLPVTLKHRVRELRRIDVLQFPAGAAMLMRSVLESAIKEHYAIRTGPSVAGTLGSVMTQVTADYGQHGHLTHSISTINRTKRGASTTPGTGEWFNLVAHSVNIDVKQEQVHEAWRAVFPLVRFLLQHPSPNGSDA